MRDVSVEEKERHFIRAGYTPECAVEMARYNIKDGRCPMPASAWARFVSALKGIGDNDG